MGASLHPQLQKEVDGLERIQRTISKNSKLLSANRVMYTGFLNGKGVIWQKYLLKCTIINAERYCETLKNLRKAIKRKRPGLLMEGVILLHDNTHPHSANVMQELLQ